MFFSFSFTLEGVWGGVLTISCDSVNIVLECVSGMLCGYVLVLMMALSCMHFWNILVMFMCVSMF